MNDRKQQKRGRTNGDDWTTSSSECEKYEHAAVGVSAFNNELQTRWSISAALTRKLVDQRFFEKSKVLKAPEVT